ncbi:MAG: bacillithiol biosynthesis cysteine-adding enzyme BshC [Gemmatimonadetes bacterium]|nr:bacillithiol biosynthesis cysteine-adding enzyme BshC [Gemmatimonadota bacterium]
MTDDLRLLGGAPAPIPALVPTTVSWDPALDAAIVSCAERDALLARLHSPGAMVVTTGQQPGLFTGPIYTVHKALAAAALARRLEAQWRRPVVALFWLAGDDHDHREASSAAWLDAHGRLDRWSLPERAADAVQHPMSREPLPDNITEGLDRLARTLPPGPDTDATMAWLERHYVAGATIHAAYAGALAQLLGPYGVACLDATHPAVKAAQRPVLAQALREATALDAVLAALPDAGTGIRAGEGATLVFLETVAGRERLLVDGDGFQARRSGDRFSASDLESLLATAPERFSANVLLRPVVERRILPTVAYVAGPGEFRYLTRQAAALYAPFATTPQTPVPRWGGTLVEPWVQRLLERLGVSAEAVLADDGTLARSILRRDLSAAVIDQLEALRQSIATTERVLGAEGHLLDPVLDRAVAGRGRKLTAVAEDLERLFERHLRKRDDIAHAQLRRVLDALRPGGTPQERHLTAATFLARYGRSWLDRIVAATDAWAAEWSA